MRQQYRRGPLPLVCRRNLQQCPVRLRNRPAVGSGWDAELRRPDRPDRPRRRQHGLRDGFSVMAHEPGLWAGQHCSGNGVAGQLRHASAALFEPYRESGIQRLVVVPHRNPGFADGVTNDDPFAGAAQPAQLAHLAPWTVALAGRVFAEILADIAAGKTANQIVASVRSVPRYGAECQDTQHVGRGLHHPVPATAPSAQGPGTVRRR
jgi:hypothetical protein